MKLSSQIHVTLYHFGDMMVFDQIPAKLLNVHVCLHAVSLLDPDLGERQS